MWPFTKKRTIAQENPLAGGTDHHSHILPGVDDGIATMEEALQALETYSATGIKELWLTPHIMEDIPNTPGKLLTRFAELQAAYTGSIRIFRNNRSSGTSCHDLYKSDVLCIVFGFREDLQVSSLVCAICE